VTVTELEPVPVRHCRICGSPLPPATPPSEACHQLDSTCFSSLRDRVESLEGLLAAFSRELANALNWRSL
jgi:hypothetical protein